MKLLDCSWLFDTVQDKYVTISIHVPQAQEIMANSNITRKVRNIGYLLLAVIYGLACDDNSCYMSAVRKMFEFVLYYDDVVDFGIAGEDAKIVVDKVRDVFLVSESVFEWSFS